MPVVFAEPQPNTPSMKTSVRLDENLMKKIFAQVQQDTNNNVSHDVLRARILETVSQVWKFVLIHE